MSKKNKYLLAVFILFSVIILGIYYFWTQNKIQHRNHETTNNKIAENKEESKAASGTPKVVSDEKREFEGSDLLYNNRSIAVLMYHSIAYEKGNELRVPKESFRQQMKYLKDNQYTTLTLDEFYDFLINNKPVPNKSVIITFDDGYRDNYENAYPILKEFGFNATIFVITAAINNEEDYLNLSQLKELEQNGIAIESHTVAHEQLDQISYEKQLDTLTKSRSYLEKNLGKEVKYIAYPFGKRNNDTIKAVKDAGYNMAFTTDSGWSNKNQGMYTLNRVYVSSDHELAEFKRRITNANYNVSQ